MTTLLSVLALGFLLGVRHATDADHVVAVTTIVARQRHLWASSFVGALWGVGHTATVFVVGGAIILFKVVIPPRLGLAMELAVAVMLIALGLTTLSGRLARVGPADVAAKARESINEAVVELEDPRAGPWTRTAIRPVVVGVVHGLAGSAAVTLLLLSTSPSVGSAFVYLLLFGLGTVAGMMVLTTVIAVPFAYTARRFDHLNTWLARATGLASVAFGALIAYQLIAAHALLSSAPQWAPQ